MIYSIKGHSLDWVTKQYLSGRTLENLAQELGCSRQAVQSFLNYHGVTCRPVGLPKENPRYQKILELIKNGEYGTKIIKETKSSYHLLHKIAKENHLEIERCKAHHTLNNLVIDRDWLYDQYIIQCRSLSDIARELGYANYTSITLWIKYHKIPLRAPGRCATVESKLFRDKNWLEEVYIKKNLTIKHISEMTNSYSAHIFYWIKKHGLRKRNKPL